MNKALEYLKEKEWSMGNGQCDECCGLSPEFTTFPTEAHIIGIGHKKDCKIAESLKDLGENVLYQGDYKPDVVYETYWRKWGDNAILSRKPVGSIVGDEDIKCEEKVRKWRRESLEGVSKSILKSLKQGGV